MRALGHTACERHVARSPAVMIINTTGAAGAAGAAAGEAHALRENARSGNTHTIYTNFKYRLEGLREILWLWEYVAREDSR